MLVNVLAFWVLLGPRATAPGIFNFFPSMFLSEILIYFFETVGIEPGVAGWEERMLPQCYAPPSST